MTRQFVTTEAGHYVRIDGITEATPAVSHSEDKVLLNLFGPKRRPLGHCDWDDFRSAVTPTQPAAPDEVIIELQPRFSRGGRRPEDVVTSYHRVREWRLGSYSTDPVLFQDPGRLPDHYLTFSHRLDGTDFWLPNWDTEPMRLWQAEIAALNIFQADFDNVQAQAEAAL